MVTSDRQEPEPVLSGTRRRDDWQITPRFDGLDFLFNVHVGGRYFEAELCTNLVGTGAERNILLIPNHEVLAYVSDESRARAKRVGSDVEGHLKEKKLGNTGAVKKVALDLLQVANPDDPVTVIDGQFGPIPVVRIHEVTTDSVSIAVYPGPKEEPPRATKGVNLRITLEAVGQVFHKLMPCYLEKAVAYLEKIYYASYRPQGVYLATKLRDFVGERIDSKVDYLIAAAASPASADPMARLVMGYRKAYAPVDPDSADFCRGLYDRHRSQIQELELARELLLLLMNGIYVLNRVPDHWDEYYERLQKLADHLSREQDLSDASARLIAACEGLSGTSLDLGNGVRAPQWAMRLENVARQARTIRDVDDPRDAPQVRLGIVYQQGVRDSEEFAVKVKGFLEEQVGAESTVDLASESSRETNRQHRIARMYFTDGLLMFHPARMNAVGPGKADDLWQAMEVLVHATRLEKPLVLIGEPKTNFEQLIEATKMVPKVPDMGLNRHSINQCAHQLRQLFGTAVIWRFPGPVLDKEIGDDLRRSIAEIRAVRAIDQVFCYRTYFTIDEWAVFQSIFEACRVNEKWDVAGSDDLPWVDRNDVYKTRIAERRQGRRAKMTQERFIRVLERMSESRYGVWGKSDRFPLLQIEGEKVRDNAPAFIRAVWGAETVPKVLMDRIHKLITAPESGIARSSHGLMPYLIHRQNFGFGADADLFLNNEIMQWSLVIRDEKTQLLTPAARRADLLRTLETARREGTPTSVIYSDIDHFKRVNDTFGHATGDKILAEVASLFLGACRERYRAYREGGEEIVVILPNTSQAEAVALAERIRLSVEGHPFPKVGKVTISSGVSCTDMGDTCTANELINVADKALYAAKEGGRNQTIAGGRVVRAAN